MDEQGRSMVEMLGVLAVAGILSVGAVAGYRTAMKKYRWNIFVKDVNTLLLNSKTITGTHYIKKENFSFPLETLGELPGGFYRTSHSLGILGYTPNFGFDYAVLWVFSGSNITIEFIHTSIDFCRNILLTNWEGLAWNLSGNG